MWTLVWSYFPILLLIFLMTKKNAMPSQKALPLVAGVAYLVMLIVFHSDPVQVHATVVKGLLVAWTPVLIIAGAIFLFRTMEKTGALAIVSDWLNSVSENKVAQLMIVGWAFPFLIEGASGFGTPAAIAAPILVGLGFPALRVAVMVLIMNSVPVSFGAVGTPTWFGFSELSLSAAETLETGFKTGLINSVAALVVPPLALLFVVSKETVWRNLRYILSSVLSTVIPYLAVTRYNVEFPSLLGGATGLVTSVLLARYNIGLRAAPPDEPPLEKKQPSISMARLVKATFPLWGTLMLLVVTRIPSLGLKQLLTLDSPHEAMSLGSLGILQISPALVLSLSDIFHTSVSWQHPVLYVPSLLPFGLISLITLGIFKQFGQTRTLFRETVRQMKNPTLALLGALVFVNLLMMGLNAPVVKIGRHLAGITGSTWQYAAAYLGALGSFFSGSNTISNLTFGGIQDAIAKDLNLNRTTILALQSVGGAMGAMVSVSNIVAVTSVLGLKNIEGYILKRTVRVVALYGLIAAAVSVAL